MKHQTKMAQQTVNDSAATNTATLPPQKKLSARCLFLRCHQPMPKQTMEITTAANAMRIPQQTDHRHEDLPLVLFPAIFALAPKQPHRRRDAKKGVRTYERPKILAFQCYFRGIERAIVAQRAGQHHHRAIGHLIREGAVEHNAHLVFAVSQHETLALPGRLERIGRNGTGSL